VDWRGKRGLRRPGRFHAKSQLARTLPPASPGRILAIGRGQQASLFGQALELPHEFSAEVEGFDTVAGPMSERPRGCATNLDI
jgi:hypothetical protein